MSSDLTINELPLSPDQLNPSPVNPPGQWRDIALPSERDELRARLDAFYAGHQSAGDDDELPADMLAIRDRLEEMNAAEETAAMADRYRRALKRADLPMEDREYLNRWLKANAPAVEPEKLPPVEKVLPYVDALGQHCIDIPGEGKSGTQKFRAKTLEELVSILAFSQQHATRKIKQLSKETR